MPNCPDEPRVIRFNRDCARAGAMYLKRVASDLLYASQLTEQDAAALIERMANAVAEIEATFDSDAPRSVLRQLVVASHRLGLAAEAMSEAGDV